MRYTQICDGTVGNNHRRSDASSACGDTVRHPVLRTVNPSALNPTQAPIDNDNSDDNPDDSCTLNDGHDCPKTGLSWLVTYSAWSWQCRVPTLVRKSEVQDHLAAERPASRLIWERIWEQNTVKPARIGAMWCNGPDI
jgi:hypothetical protein